MNISPLVIGTEDEINYNRPWIKSYNKNTPSNLAYPDKTIYEMLLDTATKNPNLYALEFMGKKTKFKKLINEVDNCARALIEMGVTEDDSVTICLPNTPHGVIMFYAVNKVGAIANMIHPLSAPKEIEFYMNNVNSKFIITGNFSYMNLKKVQDNINIEKIIIAKISDFLGKRMSMGFWALEGRKIPKVEYKENKKLISWKNFTKLGQKSPLPNNNNNNNNSNTKSTAKIKSKMKPGDGAVVLYTGGTTGVQKGVLLSNNNFNALIVQCLAHLNNENLGEIKGDKIMCILPMFHGFGLTVCVHLPISTGACAILVPKFNATIFADKFAKHKPQFIAGVPTLYEALLRSKKMKKTDFSCLKGVFAGGDSVPVDLKLQFDEFIKSRGSKVTVQEGYGLTETVTVSCLVPNNINNNFKVNNTINDNSKNLKDSKLGSMGIPLPDMIYKVVNVGTTQSVPYGVEGEICISGPTVMLGYYNNKEETNNVLKVHEDGFKWCHTGDLGYMDEDGFFYFKSRIKRIIKSSGYSVFPTQIEDVINKHEAVSISCVIGVPDEYQIEKIKAFVILKEKYTKNIDENQNKIIKKEIMNLCKEYLAIWSMPRDIEIRDTLPTTQVGKIDYIELKKESVAVK
ncbi:MAG: AMP-binding protein [Methanobacteriaceae archaeon]